MAPHALRSIIACLVAGVVAASHNKTVLIVGDSWGTVFATGTVLEGGFFEYVLKKHGCAYKGARNIAIAGSTAAQWSTGKKLENIKNDAKFHDVAWITLMGNDAQAQLPACAATGRSAEECGTELFNNVMGTMGTILDAVHESNPDMRVVGFGYDIMFGGLGCSLITHKLFPQCKNDTHSFNRCFNTQFIRPFQNTQFIRLQQVWETLASTRPYVDTINLLGTTQAAGGVPDASIGHPNLDHMGPAKYWPDYEFCIHPGVLPVNTSGSMVIMEEFYQKYWSTELGC